MWQVPTIVQNAIESYLPHVTAALTESLGDHLLGLALFGSCARGHAKSGSDIDLLTVVDATGRTVDDAIGRALASLRDLPEAERLRNLEIDPTPALLVHSLPSFARHPLILLEVVTDGQVLADPHGVLRDHFAAVLASMARHGTLRVLQPDGSWYWDLKPGMRAGDEVSF